MKILIVDNNINSDSWGSFDLQTMARLAPEATISTKRAPQGDLPSNISIYDRIILSGSKTRALEDAPWIDQLIDLIKKAIDLKKPLLGICYGHQALVRAIGGKEHLAESKIPEYGWTKINVFEVCPLFNQIPDYFYSFSAHQDEVVTLPPGTQHVASSEDCSIQAFQLENSPIFGIQFHPEKNLQEAEKILTNRKKMRNSPPLLNPDKGEKLYQPIIGETLFRNFFSL